MKNHGCEGTLQIQLGIYLFVLVCFCTAEISVFVPGSAITASCYIYIYIHIYLSYSVMLVSVSLSAEGFGKGVCQRFLLYSKGLVIADKCLDLDSTSFDRVLLSPGVSLHIEFEIWNLNFVRVLTPQLP